MLVELRVQGFILLDRLELRLEPGFNVITGETGAGKSILVGALGLVLGGRARADVIRPGAREAEVEALFDVSHSAALCARLEEAGIPSNGELCVRRVVQEGGRSRAYLNGRLCSVAELAALGVELADVTSQHESVALADPSRHLDHLDRYARLVPSRHELGEAVGELVALHAEMRSLRDREQSRAEREGFLRYQLDAIRAVAPQPGELVSLEGELGRLRHAARLREVTARAAARLEEGNDVEGDGAALCSDLGRVAADLRAAADLDADLAPLAREVEECWSRLREVAGEAARYADRAEASPARLAELEERRYRVQGLLRRHGPTLEAVLEAAARLEAELADLDAAEARLPELELRAAQLLSHAAGMARELSRSRHRAGKKLGIAISTELAALGMGKARVVVDVAPDEGGGELVVDGARLGPCGIDRVQFLIAPNRGLDPRPLARIASGGELSRALLALKSALGPSGSAGAADHDGARAVGVQVFDEVDSGVGGETADRIGRAIAAIAAHRQVLCITHLAAIAAHADAHFVATKAERADTTVSALDRVGGDERIAELARMLTGAQATQSARRAARDLLAAAARRSAA
jgi:DNA repair protein RecN (Recombination protein N)